MATVGVKGVNSRNTQLQNKARVGTSKETCSENRKTISNNTYNCHKQDNPDMKTIKTLSKIMSADFPGAVGANAPIGKIDEFFIYRVYFFLI